MAGTRILLIEDNAINMELMLYMLRAWGHDVVTATQAVQGMEMERRDPPKLIISDVQVPGMDGYQFARTVKADPQLRDIPLMALTAYAMVGDRERARAAGFDGYFSKPIEPAAFMAALQGVLPDKGAPPGGRPGGRPSPRFSRPLPQGRSSRPLSWRHCRPCCPTKGRRRWPTSRHRG